MLWMPFQLHFYPQRTQQKTQTLMKDWNYVSLWCVGRTSVALNNQHRLKLLQLCTAGVLAWLNRCKSNYRGTFSDGYFALSNAGLRVDINNGCVAFVLFMLAHLNWMKPSLSVSGQSAWFLVAEVILSVIQRCKHVYLDWGSYSMDVWGSHFVLLTLISLCVLRVFNPPTPFLHCESRLRLKGGKQESELWIKSHCDSTWTVLSLSAVEEPLLPV